MDDRDQSTHTETTAQTEVVSFRGALKKLNIEDYYERIWRSNSHGELFHVWEYIRMAQTIGDDATWFRPVFINVCEVRGGELVATRILLPAHAAPDV